MSNYEETKTRWDTVFKRSLSDKEFAEAMFEKWQESVSDYNALLETHDDLRADYAKAIERLHKSVIDDKWIGMIDKIEAALCVPAVSHEINIRITDSDVIIECRLEL